MPEFRHDTDIPRRTMVARIYRVDAIEGRGPARLSIEFDGVDEEALDGDYAGLLLDREDVKPFGLLRMELRPGQTLDDQRPRVGAWFSLSLSTEDGQGRLPVWHAQLTEDGYLVGSRGFAGDISHISDDDEPPLKPVGATVSPKRKKAQKALNGGIFPQGAIVPPSMYPLIHVCPNREPPHRVLVRDVGQASFVSLQDARGVTFLNFDAGWPVQFNIHTAPAPTTVTNFLAPVILSHWDWDHLHGYYIFPDLQNEDWVTPVQTLGPGASRVAAQLHARGLLFGLIGPMGFGKGGWGKLVVCGGVVGNKNQTGLALAVDLASPANQPPERILMTGDGDYQYATALGTGFSGLVVTHHGATFSGAIPTPTGAGQAVVSYGDDNTYGHPNAAALSAHKSAGWNIEHTADLPGKPSTPTTPRGSRYLP